MGVTARKGTSVLVVLDDDCCPAVLSTPLTEDQATVLAHDFAALADPVRLRLLSLLASAPTGEACVCELTEPLARSQPTVSHHLKILVDAGLIVGDSLLNVAFAGVVAAIGKGGPIDLVDPGFATKGILLGLVAFIFMVAWLYRHTRRAAA